MRIIYFVYRALLFIANIWHGWFTSLLGMAGMVLNFLHWYKMIRLPDFMPNDQEMLVTSFLFLGLFVFPKTKIEVFLSEGWAEFKNWFKR